MKISFLIMILTIMFSWGINRNQTQENRERINQEFIKEMDIGAHYLINPLLIFDNDFIKNRMSIFLNITEKELSEIVFIKVFSLFLTLLTFLIHVVLTTSLLSGIKKFVFKRWIIQL